MVNFYKFLLYGYFCFFYGLFSFFQLKYVYSCKIRYT